MDSEKFLGQQEEHSDNASEWDNVGDWDDSDWLEDSSEEVDEETKKNVESWGRHVFDEDFDPKVRLTEDDLVARDINNSKRRRQNLRNERAQEQFERELNKGLTDIDELLIFAENGMDGLSEKTREYDGTGVKVIRSEGYPLRFLKHSVNSGEIRKDPSIWTKEESEFGGNFTDEITGSSFNTEEEGSASNVIAATYVDTDINPGMMGSGGLTYIFSKVWPDSVVRVAPGDANSTGNEGKDRPSFLASDRLNLEETIKTPEWLATESRGKAHNEVVIRRYDEHGKPLLPTAILVHERNGISNLDDETLRAATYFQVPIIEVGMNSYEDKK